MVREFPTTHRAASELQADPRRRAADFNAAFGTGFSDADYDTVGGLVIAQLGRLPKRGETLTIEGHKVQVLRADSRRVYTLIVEKPKA